MYRLCALLSAAICIFTFPLISHSQEDILYEGDEITGGVYLGMSRSELVNVSQQDACASRTTCSFRLPTVAADNFISVDLSNGVVTYIRVQRGDYLTSITGTGLDAQPSVVADAYEDANYAVDRIVTGESRRRRSNPTYIVRVSELGYEYHTQRFCFYDDCEWSGTHHIYFPQ